MGFDAEVSAGAARAVLAGHGPSDGDLLGAAVELALGLVASEA